ncbi:hypothetical protein LMG29542_06711 [Paraburkholderia humisilvae]|uniref:Uncharacterized protein n=1 Tax=Paraburkholderia humisilvae TaxID=627669 RepID=A0A6J5F3F2_9BURK|nr:hypothetical protein [Paraburkholderia humisilvae]CAB3771786.1 hypothetical protein LMG29542_06711 [Paraburkholderia humisilvae]
MSKLKSLDELFDGPYFDAEIIILRVRWYLRYKLSLRELVEMMAERGLSLAHTTILRRVATPCAGIHQALESFWHTYGTVVACRRDLPEDSWQVGVSLQGG